MTRWEYAVVPELVEGLSSATIAKVLNSMGRDGWELAGVVGRTLILKRPCCDQEPACQCMM